MPRGAWPEQEMPAEEGFGGRKNLGGISLSDKKYNDLIGAGLLIALSVFALCVSRQIPMGLASGLGADFLPTVCSAILLVIGLVLALQAIGELKKADKSEKTERAEPKEKGSGKLAQVLLTFVLLFVYDLLLKTVGFVILTPVYLFLQMLLIAPKDKRKPVWFVVLGMLTTAVIYMIFTWGFSIILPMGLLK